MGLGVTSRRSAALERLERMLGRILRAGVLLAAALLVAGLALWLVDAERTASHRLLHGGLFALMATPVLRVIVSVVGFARQGDRFFTLVALAVLGVLGVTAWAAVLRL